MLNQTLKLDVMGLSHVNVDGRLYCSLHCQQLAQGDDALKFTGLMPMKIPCDPEVSKTFKLPEYPYPCDVDIQVTMAGQGKMGQRVVAVRPAQHVRTGKNASTDVPATTGKS